MLNWVKFLLKSYRKSAVAGGRITVVADAVSKHHGGFLLHDQLRSQGYSLVKFSASTVFGLTPVFVNKQKTKVFDFTLKRQSFDEWQMCLTLNDCLTQLLKDNKGGAVLTEIPSLYSLNYCPPIARTKDLK